MLKLWRRQGEYSMIAFANRFPIIDEILVCAVRVYLVGEGMIEAGDFRNNISY
jgi:hypothetical protein